MAVRTDGILSRRPWRLTSEGCSSDRSNYDEDDIDYLAKSKGVRDDPGDEHSTHDRKRLGTDHRFELRPCFGRKLR